MTGKNKYGVKAGQIWEDNDPRYVLRRKLEVISLDDNKATCKVVYSGRLVHIRLDRFKPTRTGYILVADCKDKK